MFRRLLVLAASLGLVAVGCDDDKSDSSSTTSDSTQTGTSTSGETTQAGECVENKDCPPGEMCTENMCIDAAWVVGDGGTVLQAAQNGDVQPELAVGVDLRDIVCRGTGTAWAVGDAGTLLHTTNGGEAWNRIELGSTYDLVAVSAGTKAVAAVSDAGDVLWSDSGDTFARVASVSSHLRAVTVVEGGVIVGGADGAVALVNAAGAVKNEVTLSAGVEGVAASHDGQTVVAVGQQGQIAWSDTGLVGLSVVAQDGPTLHAVQLAHDGRRAIAVGDAGAIVKLEDGEVSFAGSVGDEALHAIHLDAAGHGMAVGAGGTIAVTHDFGRNFVVVSSGGPNLRGVDAVGAAHW